MSGPDDDELIERLRRSLRAEAAAITPDGGTPHVSRLATRRRRARVPVRLGAGLGVAALVAAAVVVSLHLTRTRQGQVVSIGSVPTATSTGAASAGKLHARRASTATPRQRPSVDRVGTGFVPGSVTFVTADEGWVLGPTPCASGSCLELAHTTDGGRHWSALSGPAASLSSAQAGALQVRFATSSDGWVYGMLGAKPVVWSTHDGGASWAAQDLPGLGAGSTLSALETADGTVHAVGLDAGGTVVVDDATVGSDTWTRSAVKIAVGAGGATPTVTLTLQGEGGWIVVDNRTTVGGAELDASGQWTAWTPPCTKTNGPALLAASTQPDVVAVCDEGVWGPAAHTGDRLLVSSDAGTSFRDAGAVPATLSGIASPSAGTVVGVGDAGAALLATFDDGGSWTRVAARPGATITQVGFENATQGVAVARSSSSGTAELLMTRDGGHTWDVTDLRS